MKRGKDDEKMMGPMFPRLHVNDADKGGPRAPPRNKMALYEQLTIPSQRFNHHGVLPLNPSDTSNLVPPGSSSQGNGSQRSLHILRHILPSRPIHPAEKFDAERSDGANMNTSFVQHEQRKRAGDEDDFRVPVFVNPGMVQSHSKTKNGMNRERLTPETPASSFHLVRVQEVSSKDPRKNGSLSSYPKKQVGLQNERKQNACSSIIEQSANSVADLVAQQVMDEAANGGQVPSESDRLNGTDACFRHESVNVIGHDYGENGGKLESSRNIENGIECQVRNECHSGEDRSSPDEVDNDREYFQGGTCMSAQQRNGDVSDGVSETSMVDSISSLDISPDDVVGIIGQKHFWKARRAIANQQRVFAVQVFELHRLIKVQRLIAKSPHLLLEGSAYLANKSSSKISPAKKLLPQKYVVKSSSYVKRKDDFEKDHHKMECSAENAVGRTSPLSSAKNNSQPSNYMPYPPAGPTAAMDTQMGNSWCFPQPQPGSHQWLIPVMSPSEGLIYKPCPASGFAGPFGGGYYNQFTPIPMPGNFMGPVYGVPAPPYHEGVGFPASGRSYFPPYGMPVMNPPFSGQPSEQINQFGHSKKVSGTINMQHQSSCNFPAQKNGVVTQATKYQHSNKDSQVQGSTASSPGERAERAVNGDVSETAPPLFPTIQQTANSQLQAQPQTCDDHSTMRAIRVVPYNPTLATESAARIFQSIQEERKHCDSV